MMVKTWQERCEAHPDHDGVVSSHMIVARMQEEIDELREAVEDNKIMRATLLECERQINAASRIWTGWGGWAYYPLHPKISELISKLIRSAIEATTHES